VAHVLRSALTRSQKYHDSDLGGKGEPAFSKDRLEGRARLARKPLAAERHRRIVSDGAETYELNDRVPASRPRAHSNADQTDLELAKSAHAETEDADASGASRPRVLGLTSRFGSLRRRAKGVET
jgi:hypothetical protein